MNRREFIIGSAALAAGRGGFAAEEKTTDGGFADVSWAERLDRNVPVLPPGAISAERFSKRCLGCHLCAAACPTKALRPSIKFSRLGKVELDFRYGYCKPGCVRCGEVCPVNAITAVDPKAKRDIHVGYAVWSKARCVRVTVGDECHACEKHCPVKAIKIIDGFPVVDTALCIGCGACEHYCPARPATAIRVLGNETHRMVRPMDETDLLAELWSCLKEGKTLVVAKDGVIVFTSEDRMTEPIQQAKDVLSGSIVADKVVGLHAAKLHAAAGVRKILTLVIAEKAKAYLEAKGIPVEAETVVPKILNRDRTGECPLDAGESTD